MKAEPALPSEITDAWDAANDHPVCGKRRDLTLQHYGELLEKVIVDLKGKNATLLAALEAARRQIQALAQSGTERIRELGGECDQWERTAEMSIRRAGIDAAIAAARGKEAQ